MNLMLKPERPGPLWRFFSSIWLAIGLMVWVGLICAIGTGAGVEEAEIVFFRSGWFAVILLILMTNLAICTLNRSSKPLLTDGHLNFPWRLSQIPFLLVHLGLLLTFSAAILTKLTLLDAQLHVAEQDSQNPSVPSHVSNLLLKKSRRIDVIGELPKGPQDQYLGLDIQCSLKSGDKIEGRVLEEIGSATAGQLVVKTAQGQRPIAREEIASISARQGRPVFLQYLGESDDLEGRAPRIVWVGLIVSLMTVVGAAFAGKYFSDGSAPIITTFVLVLLSITLIIERPKYRNGFLNDRLTVSYQKYYPHARVEEIISDDGPLNPALQIRLGAESIWLFKNPQQTPQVDGRAPFVSPIEYGPIKVYYEQWANPRDKEADLVERRKPNPRGRVVLTDPTNANLRIEAFDDEVEGRTFDFGPHRVAIKKVFKNFRVRAKKPPTPPQTDPNNPPASQPSKPDEFEVTDDVVQGLQNPAIEYLVDDEKDPRYAFAWFEDFNALVNKGRPALKNLSLHYHGKAKPLEAPAIVFAKYADASHAILILEEGAPTREIPVTAEQHEIVTMNQKKPDGSFEEMRFDLELLASRDHWRMDRDTRPVTAEVAENFKDYPDAVFVEISDGTAKDSGWLMFQRSLPLRLGELRVLLRYSYQTEVLPFFLKLDRFEIETHPGTSQPSEFRSTVTVIDKTPAGLDQQFAAEVYMNHTLDYRGFRFFQSSYSILPGEPKVSIFSVTSDPGTPLFYAGCIVLCFGVLVIFFVKPSLVKIERRQARIAAGLPPDGTGKAEVALAGSTSDMMAGA